MDELTELRKLHAETLANKGRFRTARDGLRVNLEKLNDPLSRRRLTSEYRAQAGRDYRRTETERWQPVAARLALVVEKMAAYKPEAIRGRFLRRARMEQIPTSADMGTAVLDPDVFIAVQNARILNYHARADYRDELRSMSLQEKAQEAKAVAATSRDPAAVELAAAKLVMIHREARKHQGEDMFRFEMSQITDAINTLPLPDQDAEVLRLAAETEAAAKAALSAYKEISDVNYSDISDKVEAVARDGAETYIAGIRERNQEHAQAVQDAAAKLTTDAVLAELKAEMQAEKQNREGVTTNGN